MIWKDYATNEDVLSIEPHSVVARRTGDRAIATRSISFRTVAHEISTYFYANWKRPLVRKGLRVIWTWRVEENATCWTEMSCRGR